MFKRQPGKVNQPGLHRLSLRNDEVTSIALMFCNRKRCPTVFREMMPIMASKTTRPVLVPDVFGIVRPVGLHLREKRLRVDRLDFTDERLQFVRTVIIIGQSCTNRFKSVGLARWSLLGRRSQRGARDARLESADRAAD